MKRQAVCFCVVMFVAMIIFGGCGEDELLLELQDEVGDLQNEINLLGVKTESAGKENERLMNEIDQLQERIDELSSADHVDPEEVSQLEEQISQIASDIEDNGGNISELDTKVVELDTLVSKVIDGGVLTAEEFRLVGEDGRLQAKLFIPASGNPFLSFYDENGNTLMGLGSVFGEPVLAMFDADSSAYVWLDLESDGGSLTFYNEDGEVGSRLTDFSLTTSVSIFSYGDNDVFMTILYLEEGPALVFLDDQFNVLSIIPLELESESQGSGFLLTKSGLVVTNHHVIADSPDIEVVFPQGARSMAAEVVLRNEVNDLVILQLINFRYSDISDTDIPYQIVSSNTVNLGEEVFALGSPLAFTLGESTKVSTGTVNSVDDPWLLQISNPIQPGNSGGPVFDSEGRLVGVVVSKLNDEYFLENWGFVPQNVNFAIKSDYLSDLITKLPEEEFDEITYRGNQLAGKSLEEQVEMLTPFMVVVKAR